MKDAKGHGSDPRGAHAAGIVAIGRVHSGTPIWGPRDREIVESLRGAIRRGDKIPPIIVDENNDILDGYHRLAAFQAEGKTKIPYTQVSRLAYLSATAGGG